MTGYRMTDKKVNHLDAMNSDSTPPKAFTPRIAGKLALMRSLLIVFVRVNSNWPIKSS